MDNPAANKFPGNIDFDINPACEAMTITPKVKSPLRQVDPWALAYMKDRELKNSGAINNIIFQISSWAGQSQEIESFMRRVSFLSVVNGIRITVRIDGMERRLYDLRALVSRGPEETIRNYESIRPRDDADKPGRIEKDFQTFLFGKGLDRQVRSNERLAVLGEDFYKLEKKNYRIIREFPTGAFNGKISETDRILPTDYIDIVTLNKYGELALIELKLNDPKLEVISQILDYALFFRCYFDRLAPYLHREFEGKIRSKKIVAYIANNHFHPMFGSIRDFYRGEKLGIEIKTSTLGFTETIGATGNPSRNP